MEDNSIKTNSPVDRLLAMEPITQDNYVSRKAEFGKLLGQIWSIRENLSTKELVEVSRKAKEVMREAQEAKVDYLFSPLSSSLKQKVLTPFAPKLKELNAKRRLLQNKAAHKSQWEGYAKAANRLSPTLWPLVGAGSEHEGALPLPDSHWGEALGVVLKESDRPFHFYAAAIHPYFHAWQKEKPSQPFGDYLKDHLSDQDLQYLSETKAVRYLESDQERSEYAVTFFNGRVYDAKGTPLNGEVMFVLSPDNKTLYMGKKERGRFHHSSFLAGGAVKSAGKAILINGRIRLLTNESGHYQPTKRQMKAMTNYLADDRRLGTATRSIPTHIS